MNRTRLLCFLFASITLFAKDRWTELNVGPFFVDTDGDTGAARQALTQLEQLRWVLGGLLESKDLQSIWPLRVMLSDLAKTNPTTSGTEFVLQNGQYVLLTAPGAHLPLGQVAIILLEANTPRMPADVEYGLQQLFDTLEAQGSRVTWGGKPAHPDLNWARIQLFATKFEYGTSFHIFLNALKGGSTLRAAEHNAFAKDATELEQEAAANLAKGDWQAVSVSGRPLDAKHDFGEHSLDAVVAQIYVADTQLSADPKMAEPAYKAAVEAGGAIAALGYAGLAQVAKLNREDATSFLESAVRAGSRSAPVYVALATDADAAEATPLLKKATQLNPLWAEPVFRQAQFASGEDKGTLLKRATQLDPRISQYWVELAQWQTLNGHASAAPGSWLRAEDSARNEAERTRIHQLRMDSEEQRLDAADAERRREREELHQADQRAQNAEAERIRAAERKANQAVNAAAGSITPAEVVPGSSTVPQKKLRGLLIKVDCLHSGARLAVKNRAGQITELFLADPSAVKLACGVQRTPRPVSISYAAQPDEERRTAGDVTEIAWR
jgi:predicted phage tail protein